MAQGYIDFSTANTKKIFNLIANSDETPKSHFSNHPPINTVFSTAQKNSTTAEKTITTNSAINNSTIEISTVDKPLTLKHPNSTVNYVHSNDESVIQVLVQPSTSKHPDSLTNVHWNDQH